MVQPLVKAWAGSELELAQHKATKPRLSSNTVDQRESVTPNIIFVQCVPDVSKFTKPRLSGSAFDQRESVTPNIVQCNCLMFRNLPSLTFLAAPSIRLSLQQPRLSRAKRA